MVCSKDTVRPKLSEKEGGRHRVFYSDYTIKDYLTLGRGSIFAASGKLASLREKQTMLYSSMVCFSLSGAQTTLSRQMELLPSEDKLIIV